MKYLSATRQKREVFAATYGMSFGFVTYTVSVFSDKSPLWWVISGEFAQSLFSLAFLLSGVIFALGVRINGRWHWSPLLRAFGIGCMAMLLSYMAIIGLFTSGSRFLTAGVTYGYISLLYWILMRGAVTDLHYYRNLRKLKWLKS